MQIIQVNGAFLISDASTTKIIGQLSLGLGGAEHGGDVLFASCHAHIDFGGVLQSSIGTNLNYNPKPISLRTQKSWPTPRVIQTTPAIPPQEETISPCDTQPTMPCFGRLVFTSAKIVLPHLQQGYKIVTVTHNNSDTGPSLLLYMYVNLKTKYSLLNRNTNTLLHLHHIEKVPQATVAAC